MTDIVEVKEPQELRTVNTSTNMLVMDSASMDSMLRVADLMSESKVTIPKHLQKAPGDCMAVVMQAVQWGMNPFAVAQKTHLSQGGALGYEAQLVNAVVVASGALKNQPEFKFIGNWTKILGKVEERKSASGGKYYVATYTKDDEDGLGVVCSATLRGETEPREITVMLSQCYPRFSTQWATDPQQQITYVAVRKFARRYAPGAILGVYTPEELEAAPPVERDITPGVQQESSLPKIDVDAMIIAARETKTDADALKFWKENNASLVNQKSDHARLKAVIAAHRVELEKRAAAANVIDAVLTEKSGEPVESNDEFLAAMDKAEGQHG